MAIQKPFLNHYHEWHDIHELSGPVEEVIAKLQNLSQDKLNFVVGVVSCYDGTDLYFDWDEPMTEAQIVKEKERRAKVKRANQARRERQALMKEIKKKETVDAALDVLKKDPELAAEFLKKFTD